MGPSLLDYSESQNSYNLIVQYFDTSPMGHVEVLDSIQIGRLLIFWKVNLLN